MIFLIAVFSLFFIYLSYRHLDWAVMFLLAALPSYLIRFKVFGIPSTILEIMILSVFFIWLSQTWKQSVENLKNRIKRLKDKKIERYPFDWEIILLLVISLASVGIGGFSDSAFGVWKAYFFEPVLLYIVIFNVLADGKANAEKLLLWPLLISALAVSFVAVYQKITGQFIGNQLWAAEGTRRVVSFFGYPNAVGLYLAPLSMLFLGWAVEGLRIKNYELRIKNVLIIVTIILSFLSILFAKSVGASLGVAAGLVIFGFFANKKSRLASSAAIVLVIVGMLVYAPARQTAYKYLTLNDFSGQVRKTQWDETWKMLMDGRGIMGAGLANYQKSVMPYHHEGIFVKDIFDPEFQRKVVFNEAFRNSVWQPLEIYLYPHNIFLNFWTELGLAGMLLFIWIIGKFFYQAIRMLRGGNLIILGLIGAMTAIVVQGLVDVPYFKNDLSVMFWVLIAMLGAMILDNKTPQTLKSAGQEATTKRPLND